MVHNAKKKPADTTRFGDTPAVAVTDASASSDPSEGSLAAPAPASSQWQPKQGPASQQSTEPRPPVAAAASSHVQTSPEVAAADALPALAAASPQRPPDGAGSSGRWPLPLRNLLFLGSGPAPAMPRSACRIEGPHLCLHIFALPLACPCRRAHHITASLARRALLRWRSLSIPSKAQLHRYPRRNRRVCMGPWVLDLVYSEPGCTP